MFEALIARQLHDRETVAVSLEKLGAQGWDVATFRELLNDYMKEPGNDRAFSAEIRDDSSGGSIVFKRNVARILPEPVGRK